MLKPKQTSGAKKVVKKDDLPIMHCAWVETPVGTMLAVATEDHLCLLEYAQLIGPEKQLRKAADYFKADLLEEMNGMIHTLQAQLEAYFKRQLKQFELPLYYEGTPFQHRVWDTLREIPYGQTWSYKELAVAAGSPGGSRAVGSANGNNPLAIVIPCHRVIAADHSLGGYSGGGAKPDSEHNLWRKRKLLELELGRPWQDGR